MRIGIDVGGTNTDAVLMNGDSLIASCKSPTSENISDGIKASLGDVLRSSGVAVNRVRCVMIGTTHFTNAFVEARNLIDVGVIRIALPAARGVPPLTDWPERLLAAVGTHCHMVRGGYQYDGRLNAPLDEAAVAAAAHDFLKKGLRTVAITSLFSPVRSDHELRAAEIVTAVMGAPSITLSHAMGRIGLLERENAAVMNASLAMLSSRIASSFRAALRELDIDAPFFVSQNDGTLMRVELVEKYPVFTFASGPTNSMRGAAYLSGVKDALVADIGGTTTDIGMLTNGFPRESTAVVDIGGVRTNFRMPDILSLGLGGGSIVSSDGNTVALGPASVGFRLRTLARVFGGDTLTASDIAVAAGHADFGDRKRIADLPASLVDRAVNRIHEMLAEGVDRMKVSAAPIPLLLVGGGSILVSRAIAGVSNVITPGHADVANAVGAAIAQVSGEADRIVSYEETHREEAIVAATDEARRLARIAGADSETVAVIEVEEIPLMYMPKGAVRLRVKVAGSLALAGEP